MTALRYSAALKSVKSIGLANNRLGVEAFKLVGAVIKSSSGALCVDVSGNTIPIVPMQTFLLGLINSKHLVELNISRTWKDPMVTIALREGTDEGHS